MINRSAKLLYYGLLSGPMRANAFLYRQFRQNGSSIKAHLGCGQKNYLAGWVNVDANFLTAKIDLWANLEHGLPFGDTSVEKIYSFHVIEHLPDSTLADHFREMYRVLIPGGMIRVGGPHIDNACLKLIEGDKKWFPEFPDKHDSIGGKFTNFVFCRNEHLTALTRSYLQELALGAGFKDLHFCAPVAETVYFDQDVLTTEYEDDPVCPHSILLEARKPE